MRSRCPLYSVPLDHEDPEDLRKLIRVAFAIKGGEFARESVYAVVPTIIRPLIKKFFSESVLITAKGLTSLSESIFSNARSAKWRFLSSIFLSSIFLSSPE